MSHLSHRTQRPGYVPDAGRAGVPLEGKAFSVGARIEHRQAAIDRGLYGKLAGHPSLPPGNTSFPGGTAKGSIYLLHVSGGTVVPAASELEGSLPMV